VRLTIRFCAVVVRVDRIVRVGMAEWGGEIVYIFIGYLVFISGVLFLV
jgi:hypothetical protein